MSEPQAPSGTGESGDAAHEVVPPHVPQEYPPARPPARPRDGDPAIATEGAAPGGDAPPPAAPPALPPPPDTGPQPTWQAPAPGPRPILGPARVAPRPAATPRPEPTPEDARAFARSVALFGFLVLAALLAGSLRLPWLVVAPLVAVAAIVVGVRTLLAGRRTGARTPVFLLAVGLALSGLFLVSSTSSLVLWPVQLERQQCLDRALTHQARDACEATYTQQLNEMLDRVAG